MVKESLTEKEIMNQHLKEVGKQGMKVSGDGEESKTNQEQMQQVGARARGRGRK